MFGSVVVHSYYIVWLQFHVKLQLLYYGDSSCSLSII
jgi:hypothetical protein